MIRMMTAALLLNTDMGIYFFVLPYLSSGLGMSQSEIGLLTAVHSVCYIAVTCLSGMRRNHLCGAFAARWSILLAAAVYLISALCPTRSAPLSAGAFARSLPRDVLAGILGLSCRPRRERRRHGASVQQLYLDHHDVGRRARAGGLPVSPAGALSAPACGGHAAAVGRLSASHFSESGRQGRRIGRRRRKRRGPRFPMGGPLPVRTTDFAFFRFGWNLRGRLAEGAFRATGAFFVRRAGFGASFWGVLLGIRLFAQMAVATALKRSGSRAVGQALDRFDHRPVGRGALPLFSIARECGTGLDHGDRNGPRGNRGGVPAFHRAADRGLRLPPGGRNYGGAAECLLGLGTFLGSLFSGFYGTERYGNPFLPVILSAALLSAAVIAILGNHIVRKNLQI